MRLLPNSEEKGREREREKEKIERDKCGVF